MDGTQKWSTVAHWMSTSRRSEEHTSELQSQSNLVCRLLLEKKNIRACVEVVVHEFGSVIARPLTFPLLRNEGAAIACHSVVTRDRRVVHQPRQFPPFFPAAF